MPSLNDVARRAGVSKSVASRVLNDDTAARISSDTRDRVRLAAHELGYMPNFLARALRHATSGAIALVVPDVNNSVFSTMLSGVREAAQKHDAVVLLAEIGRGRNDSGYLSQLVKQGRVDGVILQRPEDFSDEDLAAAIGDSLPLVLANSSLPGTVHSAILPDAQGARIAVEHLISRGHERIGHITGFQHHDTARRRHSGFIEAMRNAGLEAREEWIIEAGWEAPGGEAAMLRLGQLADRPTAVLVSSVNAAIGARRGAHLAGLDVPEDISLVTINDTWAAAASVPALSAVEMPLHQLGVTAADMLFALIRGRDPADSEVGAPPPRLLARESVRRITAPAN